MSKRIGSTPFADLLANSIADDPTIRAMADALDLVLNKLSKTVPELLIFARLAHDSGFINPVPMLPPMTRLAELAGGLVELPPKLLDLLGWQLHVECYDRAVSLQAKREILQASLLLHRRHGTPWSVRHALETLLEVPADLPEWFMYGGEPYFFRVRLDVSGVMVDMAWIISALKIIFDYKNVRSWLEYLRTYSVNPCPAYLALTLVSRSDYATRLWLYPKKPPKAPAYIATGSVELTVFSPAPQPEPDPVPMENKSAPGIVTVTRSYTCPTN